MSELQTIETKLTWIFDLKHLILAGLLALAIFSGIYLFESKRADVADEKAQAAEQIAQAAQKAAADSAAQNASIQAQNAQVQATLSAANQQLQQTVGQLKTANSQLTFALTQQQKIDSGLSATGQAARWQSLVPGSTVTSTSAGFQIDSAGGLSTLQSLEEVATDRDRIANFTAEVKADEDTLTNTVTELQSEKAAHAADIVNDRKQYDAEIAKYNLLEADYKKYKTHARRNYLKAFGIGFVIGFVSGHAVTF